MLMDAGYATINAWVTFGVVLFGLVSFGLRVFHGKPDFLDSTQHKATTWGFGFWLCWWLSMACVYTVAQHKGNDLVPLLLWLLDLGDLALIGFAIAYLGGDEKLKVRRFAPLAILFAILSIFYGVIACVTGGKITTLAMVYVIAPSVALAIGANIVAGWAFLVRWGYTATLLFLVAVIYAVCQGPAYHILFVVRTHASGTNGANAVNSPEQVFYVLALGKLFIAAMSSMLFLSTVPNAPNMKSESYWPTWQQAVPLRPAFRRAIVKWIAAVAALMSPLLAEPFRDWIGRQF